MHRNEPQLIVNATRTSVVCHHAVIADRPLARMRGLLGCSGLAPGHAVLLSPASSIHTAFMRFAIDAVFLDSDLRVLKVASHLRPWRTAGARRARAVLEVGAGEGERLGIEIDDQFELQALAVPGEDGACVEAAPQVPARILLVVADRRFRMLASTSLTRRGYHVTVNTEATDIAELAARECVDVAVIDATASLTAAASVAARLQAVRPRMGVVAVSDDPRHALSAFPVLPRWGSFDSLCGAIEEARGHADR
jgi:uncharacterized protein